MATNFKKCPSCRKWVPRQETECPHCGASQGLLALLQGLWARIVPMPEGSRRPGRLCVACNRLVGVEDTTCPHCGAAQSGARKAARAAAGLLPGRLTGSHWVGLLCVALFAIPILAFQGVPGFDTWGYLAHGTGVRLLGIMEKPLVAAGEYWRLVTPVFLHGGILHLVFNMYALTLLGPLTESIYGRGWFFALFVATGVAGFVASYLGTPAASVGASGALFGILGVAIVQAYRFRDSGHNRQLLRQLGTWAAFGFLLGYALGFDNWGHGGGFVAGVALSFVLPPERVARGPRGRKLGSTLAFVALVVVGLCFLLAFLTLRAFLAGLRGG